MQWIAKTRLNTCNAIKKQVLIEFFILLLAVTMTSDSIFCQLFGFYFCCIMLGSPAHSEIVLVQNPAPSIKYDWLAVTVAQHFAFGVDRNITYLIAVNLAGQYRDWEWKNGRPLVILSDAFRFELENSFLKCQGHLSTSFKQTPLLIK